MTIRARAKRLDMEKQQTQAPVFPNLVDRQFTAPQIDLVYASDVTYIWTQEGGVLSGDGAICLFLENRGVESSQMKAQLGCNAITMAM